VEKFNEENSITFYELQWDTDFFGVSSCKVILHKPLTLSEWKSLKSRLKDYQFVSIENRNSEPINSQFIGKDTNAFLADVNIQFKKNILEKKDKPKNVEIYNALQRNNQIVEMAEFKFSRFIEDPELAKRGGPQVYRQWVINSFGDVRKYFALSKNNNGQVDGFLLHSYKDNVCVVELIAVSENNQHKGIGTSLFSAIEYEAYKLGCDEIKVGTQIRNTVAINFYHKLGCKQVGCHQIYHLWNL